MPKQQRGRKSYSEQRTQRRRARHSGNGFSGAATPTKSRRIAQVLLMRMLILTSDSPQNTVKYRQLPTLEKPAEIKVVFKLSRPNESCFLNFHAKRKVF
jgi:hypothetical protein